MVHKRLTGAFLALSVALATLAATATSATAGGRLLQSTLTGEAEPDGGDEDGSGVSGFLVRPAKGKLCFAILVTDITLPSIAAHIHKGAEGVIGPPVVTLVAPDETGAAFDCLSDLGRKLLRRIANHPERFYVNVHTTDFPGGAVRGQLEPVGA